MPAKHAVSLNPEVLPETTLEETALSYVDIAALEGGDAAASLSPKELTFGTAPSRARRVLRAGDTILSTVRTYLKAVANFPEASDGLVASTGFAVFRPNGRLHPRFAYWAALSEPFIENVVAHSEGVSYPAINPSVLGSLHMPMPPRLDQERIADFLDEQTARIDALIAEKERLTSALAELRTARIWSAVTGQGAPSRQTVPESPWSPSIPSHWKVTPVGRFARLQRGFDLPEEERWPGSVPVMSGGGISGWHSNARVKGPGVVTGRYGTIGILHYVEEDYWPLNTSLFVDDFFGNNEKYVYYVLSFLPWDMLGGKSAVPGVNRNDVHPLLVGAPPRVEQDAIVASLDTEFAQLSALNEHVQAHIVRLREYRSSLISAAVTGQLDVSMFKKAVQ